MHTSSLAYTAHNVHPLEQAAAKRRADAIELVRTDPVLRDEVRGLLELMTAQQ